MIGKKQIHQWKVDEVNHLVELFKQFECIAVIDVHHLNDKQIQEMRKLLRGEAVIRMSKKNLQLRAIEQYKTESKKDNLDELGESIPGQSALCFTNMSIFKLKKIFNENEWMVPAKPNEITPVDIWVLAGDTGLPTGQVISELNMTLRLPTRLQNDTIWIREDTRTHKTGDTVDVKQAAVLKKLGITPIESLIKIHYAWSNGEIIPEDILYMDVESLHQDIVFAYFAGQKLALELGYVDKETIRPLTQRAYREAMGILFEVPIYIEEMRDEYLRKAATEASILKGVILGEGTQTPTQPEDSKEKEKEPEEEKDEEVGIGNLFG